MYRDRKDGRKGLIVCGHPEEEGTTCIQVALGRLSYTPNVERACLCTSRHAVVANEPQI